jgi:hypothetical protein
MHANAHSVRGAEPGRLSAARQRRFGPDPCNLGSGRSRLAQPDRPASVLLETGLDSRTVARRDVFRCSLLASRPLLSLVVAGGTA